MAKEQTGHCEDHSGHCSKLETLEKANVANTTEHSNMWSAISKRIPTWYSLLFAAACSIASVGVCVAWQAKNTEMQALSSIQRVEMRIDNVERTLARLENQTHP